jgi:hypothetical protein
VFSGYPRHEDLDILFANGVPARKFKSYEVDTCNEQAVQETVAGRQSDLVVKQAKK